MVLNIKPPQKVCNDRNCPFHGSLKIRGRMFEGSVVRDKMERSVIVNIDYLKYYPKYERYARMRSRIPAHNPPCIG
ncbi:MAG: 30S ribosomal protein S17, partial [Candidatus Bathyarchaeia archaeon]